MKYRLAAGAILAAAFSLSMLAQTSPTPAKTPAKAATSKAYVPPKTPWGEPDLQGSWPAQFNIPRERPAAVKEVELSEEQFAQRQTQTAKAFQNRTENPGDNGIGPPQNWGEIGRANTQTSVVIDPPDGRMPPMTPQARAVLAAERNGHGPGQHFPDKVDSWEDFDQYSRCITRGFPNTMLYTLYDYGNQIVQSPGYVVIRSEMVHETRIIPTDGRPHLNNIKTYMGNSVGHWEGNTLVVETTGLRPESGGNNARYTDAAKIVERFTRTAPDTLIWEATVSDPNVWTRPFTLRYPYKLDAEYTIYEYACHEGNYMMLDALRGARDIEKQGRETKVSNDNFRR